jgi:CRISPR-associated endonuclease/helicase Cas3
MRGVPGENDLWGKLGQDSRGDVVWHPLVDHSLDVAAVLERLLQQPTIRRRLARAASRGLDPATLARLAFLAFIHDLGKCAAGFQAKARSGSEHTVGHLSALKALSSDELGPELQRSIDVPTLVGWAGETIHDYLLAVFAHHGKTPELEYSPGSDRPILRSWRAQEGAPLQQLAALIATGRESFAEAFEPDVDALPDSPAFQHLFAGLLMLADWIGSNADWFPFSEPGDPPRLPMARSHAATVLAAIRFAPPPLVSPLPAFEAQFGVDQPRPAQQEIDRLPLPDEAGSIVLLESETGSGKTEAALRWASRLIEAGLVDGCYFAVPLRSAAVQLHGRMGCWLKRTYGDAAPEPLLAVPGYFRMGEAEGWRLPDHGVQWSDAETTDRKAERWAAEQPKRYMAAAFAVGTIDQALLGALAVKHAHLRAACLVRHLLVIDEVHSSDAYMTTLAERLMALFKASGGHVLLMSATVGAGTRERLVFGRRRAPPLDAAIATAYPRITASHAPAVDITADGAGKSVQIDPRPLIDDAAAVAGLAAEAVAAGARVLVLRNTVKAAIETQEALEALLAAEHDAFFRVNGVITLHHGRFAAEDRKLLDEAVEGRFGKAAPAGPAVIVATQTLEQSLDVDADLLITDLAPVDVLLQRIGRLHRHVRQDRPAGCERARCVVLLPDSSDLSTFLDKRRARHGIGFERAYQNVISVEATRRLLMTGPTWVIPTDNRSLVERGTHEATLTELAQSLGEEWMNAWTTNAGGSLADEGAARLHSLDFSEPFRKASWPPKNEMTARTRLGADDLMLALDEALTSPFDPMREIKHIKIARWLAPDNLTSDELQLKRTSPNTFLLLEFAYEYGRFGLKQLPAELP